MSDLPSSLGIEAVQLLAEGGRSVTVRVTGRWRRRRPELRGQPMLVVETDAGRQRFLAMPEPPSLTGAAPGTWRMSFSVPAALAAELPGRTFLQLGGVMVPLPVGDAPSLGAAAEAHDADLLEARRARGEALAAESARREATELAALLARVERERDDARAQSERLREAILDHERRLRSSEQHVHAERALRDEVEQELSRRSRSAEHDLRLLHERVAELERELTRMRRAVDEAQHLAVAAEAARTDAEQRLKERAPAPHADSTLRERDLLRTTAAAPPPPTRPALAARASDQEMLRQESAMAERRAALADARVAVLERELAAARKEIEVQRARSMRAYEAIELVRGELRQLRVTTPVPAQAPSPLPMAEPVEAERLSAALARLRNQATPAPVEETPHPEPAQATAATKPWLAGVFRALAAEDPSAAGRLVLALLPAQRAADPHPVAYDLVLSDLLVAHVTVASAATRVELDATARPLSEVDFQLIGDLAGIARLLAAGRLRRRLHGFVPGRRVARLRGDRHRLAALDRLLRAPLGLQQLHAAGVRADPVLAFTVAALAIDPAWTAGERFTIGHRAPDASTPDAYLHVRDARRPLASGERPHGPVEAVVVCPADELLGSLAGAAVPAEVEGEQRPLALLGQWLERAQSG